VVNLCLELKPWETYQADMSIDLKKHHAPTTFLDKFAYWTVKSLRWPTDIFFQVIFSCFRLGYIQVVFARAISYLNLS